MLLKANIRLLLGQLDRLAETPSFNPSFDKYVVDLRQVADCLIRRLERGPTIDLGIVNLIVMRLWTSTQFLIGSTNKQIPYEVVFAIHKAAREWTEQELIVTTAILQEPNFYFFAVQEDFFEATKTELGVEISARPVQIALPYIYRHKPLFCVPLFHELGHFVDVANKVTATSLLISPPEDGPDLADLPSSVIRESKDSREKAIFRSIVNSHRQEYFSDLFAAMYLSGAG